MSSPWAQARRRSRSCNNMYVAPQLNGHNGGNVMADDPFVTGDVFRIECVGQSRCRTALARI